MTAPFRPTLFTQRLGARLQRQRQRQGLTQADLAERADLSVKYVGEIERGEANATAQALERIAVVLEWDPWTLFALEQQPISQQVHQLLTTELGGTRRQLDAVLAWLGALDPARRDASAAGREPTLASLTLTPRRRGRPRVRKEGGNGPHA